MKGLYSGRQVIDLKSRSQKITRSQTAKQAYDAIIKKYGSVSPHAHYFHKGKGEWHLWSLERDKMRTGKIAPSKKEWAERPNKFDWPGIDTKEASKKSGKFSVSAMKAPSKITGRTAKAQPVRSKLTAVKHTGYFGQDLTQGKFGAGANLKRAIIEILKKKYPKTQFLVMKADHKLTNSSWIHIYWSGEPNVREIESLYINMGGQGRKDFRMNKHEVEYHHIDANEMNNRISQMTRTPSAKTFYQATVFGPKPQIKKSLNLSVTSLKSPAKLSGRTSKPSLQVSKTQNVKSIKKPKVALTLSKLKAKAPKGRGNKVPVQKHVPVPKILDSNAYMKNSPYTKQQVSWYNNYSFYDVDINKEFNGTVDFMEAKVRKQYPNGIPPEVLKALARYRKAIYDSYLAESKARSTAPSQMVVGPAGYKNFDKKIGRANNMRQKSLEDVHYAEKQIDLAMKRVNTKDTTENIKGKYAVNIGDTVMLHWTNNYRKYSVPAKVIRVNVNTLVGRLLEDNNGYEKGQERSVPMNGTKGNGWSHIGSDKPKVATNKELVDKYLAEHPSPFKVGDKVYNKYYRFTGNVIKMNKQTMVIKGEPTYNGDDGLRKVTNDTEANTLVSGKEVSASSSKSPKFSLKQLKNTTKPIKRNSKKPISLTHTPVTKSIRIEHKPKYKGFLVTGNTYPLKSQLKAMGGKWVPDEEGWVIPISAAKQLKAFAKGKKLSIHGLKTEENVFRHFTEAERLERRNAKAEKKIDKWEGAAARRGKEAQSHYRAADNLVKDIPLGQPILVGHYTEKAHRRVLERAQNHMFKGVELQQQGRDYEEKAASLTHHMKYIDDPNQLKGRIAKLEKELKYWENKLKNNDKEIAGATAAHKMFSNGSASSEAAFKKEVEQMKGRVSWYKENIENKKADIASIKAMLPAEMTKVSTGITMTDLTKLKKPLGLVSAAKRYHNKNLSGGNFAIELRYGKEMGQGLEIHGTHNPDGVVNSLGLYTIRMEYLKSLVNKSDYSEMTLEKLIPVIKKYVDAAKQQLG